MPTAPTEIVLFAPGVTETHNGIATVVDEETLSMMAAFQKDVDSKTTLPVMINHGRDGIESGRSYGKGKVDASLDRGIRLVDIEWTDDGKKLVEGETYLYTSPRFTGLFAVSDAEELQFSERGSLLVRPQMFDELSLTNTPATTNMKPLVSAALSRSSRRKKGKEAPSLTMTCTLPFGADDVVLKKSPVAVQLDSSDDEPEEGDEPEEELTDEESKDLMDKLQKDNEALRLENEQLKAENADLKKANAQAESAESAALTSALTAEGRLSGTMAAWLLSQPVATVRSFAETARKEPVAAATLTQAAPTNATGARTQAALHAVAPVQLGVDGLDHTATSRTTSPEANASILNQIALQRAKIKKGA